MADLSSIIGRERDVSVVPARMLNDQYKGNQGWKQWDVHLIRAVSPIMTTPSHTAILSAGLMVAFLTALPIPSQTVSP
jgi:hypothetical protein